MSLSERVEMWKPSAEVRSVLGVSGLFVDETRKAVLIQAGKCPTEASEISRIIELKNRGFKVRLQRMLDEGPLERMVAPKPAAADLRRTLSSIARKPADGVDVSALLQDGRLVQPLVDANAPRRFALAVGDCSVQINVDVDARVVEMSAPGADLVFGRACSLLP